MNSNILNVDKDAKRKFESKGDNGGNKVYCPHCGASLNEGTTICSNCGKSLVKEETVEEKIETTIEQTVEEKSDDKKEKIQEYKKWKLITKIFELAFILALIFIPCFVTKMKIEGEIYEISYGFIDVVGLFVKAFKEGGYVSILSDIISLYLIIFIVFGGVGCLLEVLIRLSGYKKETKLEEIKKENDNTGKKKKNGNSVVNIVVGLVLGFLLYRLDIPYIGYIRSGLYYSVNLWIAVPAIALILYLIANVKFAKIKKELLNNEK